MSQDDAKKPKPTPPKQLNLFTDQFSGQMAVSSVSQATGRCGFMSGSGVSTVGLAIARNLRTGPVEFRGHQIHTAEDLAALVQIARDPRIETLRFVYTKGNTIVGHKAIT